MSSTQQPAQSLIHHLNEHPEWRADPRAITLLRAPAVRGRIRYATKRWVPGEKKPRTGDRVKYWVPLIALAQDIYSLSAVLTEASADPSVELIRGRVKEASASKERVNRRMHDDPKEPNPPDIEDCPRHAVGIDLDDVDEPTDFKWLEDPRRAAIWAADRYTPEPFHGCVFHYEYSSSAGFPGKKGLRLHLWYWLESPANSSNLKEYFTAFQKSLPKEQQKQLDFSLYCPVQPHYIAAPVIEGITDPLKGRRRGLVAQDRISTVKLSLSNAVDPSQDPAPTKADLAMPTPEVSFTSEQLLQMLAFVTGLDRAEWFRYSTGVKHYLTVEKGHSDEEAYTICDKWWQSLPNYNDRENRRQWRTMRTDLAPREQVTIGTVIKAATEKGWKPTSEQRAASRAIQEQNARDAASVLTPESSTAEIRRALESVRMLPSLEADSILKLIKAKTGTSMGALRKQLFEDEHGEGVDYGRTAANYVLEHVHAKGAHLIRADDKAFWQYNGRHWERVMNDDRILKECIEATAQLGPIKSSQKTVAEAALRLIQGLTFKAGDPLRLTREQPRVINCQNGELWFTEDNRVELRPHRADSYLTYCLGVDYDPVATCETFDRTLLEIFDNASDPPEMVRHLMELFGYAIQPRRNHKSWWIFYGSGNNGKTKVVETMHRLMNRASIYAGRISDIEKDQFKLAALTGKLMFLDDDVATNTVLPDGFLKKISEEKLLTGRHLYVNSHEFVVTVVPLLLVNNFPYSRDLSPGTQNRVQVVPFARCFSEGKDDNKRLFPDIWQRELPGILNRAIEGYQRLENRGGFLPPKDCKEAKMKFLAAANPLVTFIEEQCTTQQREVDRERQEYEAYLRQVRKNNPEREWTKDLRLHLKKMLDDRLASVKVRQTTKEFYQRFKDWCAEEGSNWVPKKSEVERDLQNLGYAVSHDSSEGQKVVEGLMMARI